MPSSRKTTVPVASPWPFSISTTNTTRKKVTPLASKTPRVSRHNGRSGAHGVYNPKHNDRQFDTAHADNIHDDLTAHNLYWDYQNGLRTHAENASGQYPTFAQVEHDFYAQRYAGYLAEQSARNEKAGHAKRNRSVDDLLNDARICPEETIYQIGKEGDCPPPDLLLAIVQEFMDTIRDRYGSNVHILDWALHLDETSPHIHARQVFDVENRYGEIEPKQEKALEALGIPLPFPDKKPGRLNNRKITYDSICRDLLLDICQEHGLAVETQAIYGGKAYREKNDYIIESQREKIAELERTNAELTSANEAQTRLLAEKDAELQDTLDQLSNTDILLQNVSEIALREAMTTVTEEAVQTTQEETNKIIEERKALLMSPRNTMRERDRNLVYDWLSEAGNAILEKTGDILKTVLRKFRLSYMPELLTERIIEKSRPSVDDLIQKYAQKNIERKKAAHRSGMER